MGIFIGDADFDHTSSEGTLVLLANLGTPDASRWPCLSPRRFGLRVVVFYAGRDADLARRIPGIRPRRWPMPSLDEELSPCLLSAGVSGGGFELIGGPRRQRQFDDMRYGSASRMCCRV